jgi:hypothetical protein
VVLSPRHLDWQPGADRKSSLDLLLAAASLSESRNFLASRVESFTAIVNNQDANRLARTEARLPVTIRIPRKTQRLRVVVQTVSDGRIGAVELDRRTIDSAPEASTPEVDTSAAETAITCGSPEAIGISPTSRRNRHLAMTR